MSDLVANHLTTTAKLPSSSKTSSTSTATSDLVSSGAIAGIIVGCITALALFVLAVLFVLRKRRRRRALPLSADTAPDEIHESYNDAELDGEPKPTEMPVSVEQPAELSGWSVGELEGSEVGDREVDSRENVEAEETRIKKGTRENEGWNRINS
jgi:hypothetical protein